MNSKDSLFTRFKKPPPCFLCNANVKNHENFCSKCKSSMISKCSTPVPKLPKSSQDRVRYFHIKQASPSDHLKKTACFNDPLHPHHKQEKSKNESINKEPSITLSKSQYSKGPSLSLDFKPISNVFYSKSQKNKRSSASQNRFFHINKSPIPELRNSTPELTDLYTVFSPAHSYVLHKNSVSDVMVENGILYSVGLDYKLQGHSLYNMREVLKASGHTKGILNVCMYKGVVVTSGKDGKIKFWEGDNCVFQQQAHRGVVKSMCTDGNLLFAANESLKIFQNTKILSNYQNEFISSLAPLSPNLLLTGGSHLKIWDLRSHLPSTQISPTGPFTCITPWDDHSIWTSTPLSLKVLFNQKFDLRTFSLLENIKTANTISLCKAKNQLFSTNSQISSFGKPVLPGPFTCLKFDEDLSMLFAGDRLGSVHIFKI